MPRLYPDRCLGIIGRNSPAGRPAGLPPVTPSEPSLIVLTANYYVVTFMRPGRAAAVLKADMRHCFDAIPSRGDIWDQEAFAKLPEDSPARQMNLLALVLREQANGEVFMSEEVMQYFTNTYQATGFTGGLKWYRAAVQNRDALATTASAIAVPSLSCRCGK